MANLPEEEKWEDVYQWETSDRALGGPGGVMNKPLRNLTNRTAFLKKQLDENTGQATTTKAGIVKLSNMTDSSSKTEAATPSAVKAVYDLAAGKLSKDSNLSDLTNVAQALQNLGLGAAAERGVGAGENQIPDMNFFQYGTYWFKLPTGHLVQFGTFTAPGGGVLATGNFPVAFPTTCLAIIASFLVPATGTVNAAPLSQTQFRIQNTFSGTQTCSWIAIGR